MIGSSQHFLNIGQRTLGRAVSGGTASRERDTSCETARMSAAFGKFDLVAIVERVSS